MRSADRAEGEDAEQERAAQRAASESADASPARVPQGAARQARVDRRGPDRRTASFPMRIAGSAAPDETAPVNTSTATLDDSRPVQLQRSWMSAVRRYPPQHSREVTGADACARHRRSHRSSSKPSDRCWSRARGRGARAGRIRQLLAQARRHTRDRRQRHFDASMRHDHARAARAGGEMRDLRRQDLFSADLEQPSGGIRRRLGRFVTRKSLAAVARMRVATILRSPTI